MTAHDPSAMVFASPCDADLDSMPSFDRGRRRFCSQCMRSVHMLSEMTRDEARGFIRDNRDACMSYRRGQDGRIEFRPAPAFVPTSRLSAPRRPSRAGLVAAPVIAALAGCAGPVAVADAIEDDSVEQVDHGEAFPTYAAIPEAVPCEPPPVEAKPERKPNNEALIRGKLPPIGNPGHYAGGIGIANIDLDDPFADGPIGPSFDQLEVGTVLVEGADEATFRRIVRRRTAHVRACLERSNIAPAAGELSVRFVVDATGKVLRSTASFVDGAPADCVAEEVAGWDFPEPEAPSATVVVRYSLPA